MPELVKIPMASAEYQAHFEQPNIGFIANDRQRVFEAIVTALLPFKFGLANTEIVATGTPADYKVIFKIPERGITFQFGAEEYRFGKEGSSWSTADEDAQVLAAAERALMEGSNVKVESCTFTIAMHLQPVAKTREEILAPFIPEPFRLFMTQRLAQTFGNHLKWADGDVLLDFSVGFANGIFLRLTSSFKGQPPLTEILAKVRRDEEAVFGILGVEDATNV
jgi:hypothetical protein